MSFRSRVFIGREIFNKDTSWQTASLRMTSSINLKFERKMKKIIKGKAFVLGDNIDTDQIIPAEHLFIV